jgi:transcriptional regulator with XRE-family HTH domain
VTPDDPRHGQPRGYYAHLKDGEEPCLACRAATSRYNNLRRMGRINPQVSALGTRRRLQALMAIGWDQHSLAVEVGVTNTRISNLVRGINPEVTSHTAARVARVYDRLSMTARDGTKAARYARTVARRQGWPPPLGWDDIDTDVEPPAGDGVDVDEVVVDRILAGDRLPATPAEKAEVVRRWLATGRRLADLERQTGWNGKREKDRALAAEGAA